MIIPEKNLVFIHSSKCAGSTVESAIFRAVSEPEAGFENVPHWRAAALSHDQKKRYALTLDDSQHWDARKVLSVNPETKAYDWCALTRDPLERAVSEFFYQKRCYWPTLKSRHQIKCYRENDISEALRSGHIFRLAYRYHFKSQADMLRGDVDIKQFKVEDSMGMFEKYLQNNVHPSLKLPVMNASPREDYHLDTFGKHMIWDRWGRDYDFCGYPKPAELETRCPRTVWMFWHAGLNKAPEVVKAAVKSWRLSNPGWDLKLLDKTSSEVKAVEQWWNNGMCWAHKSDILRAHILTTQGGVWADATTLCLKPLSTWLDAAISSDGIFVFRNAGIANWFIAAKKGSPAMAEWWVRMLAYLKKHQKPKRYIWAHPLFVDMLETGWASDMGWIDASDRFKLGPHMLSNYTGDANGTPGPFFFQRLLTESPPMLKMSRHLKIKPGSKFDILIKSFL